MTRGEAGKGFAQTTQQRKRQFPVSGDWQWLAVLSFLSDAHGYKCVLSRRSLVDPLWTCTFAMYLGLSPRVELPVLGSASRVWCGVVRTEVPNALRQGVHSYVRKNTTIWREIFFLRCCRRSGLTYKVCAVPVRLSTLVSVVNLCCGDVYSIILDILHEKLKTTSRLFSEKLSVKPCSDHRGATFVHKKNFCVIGKGFAAICETIFLSLMYLCDNRTLRDTVTNQGPMLPELSAPSTSQKAPFSFEQKPRKSSRDNGTFVKSSQG